MLAVKGIYKQGKIELLDPIEDIREADLYIIVIPREKTIEKNAILINDREILEFDEWIEEEIEEMYSWIESSTDSLEVIFDEN